MGAERLSGLVFGIHHHGHGGELCGRAEASPQRVHQQELAHALTLERGVDRQATQDCHGQLRVARQLLGQFLRQFVRTDHRNGERAVTEHATRWRQHENERGSEALVGVLARLLVDLAIKGLRATSEFAAVVTPLDGLDAVPGWRLVRQSQPQLLAICSCGPAQSS